MATDLTGLVASLLVSTRVVAQKALDLSTPESSISKSKTHSLTFGTGAAKADMVWSDRRALGASANETLDLVGSLTNAFGVTVSFSKIKAILLHNRSDEQGTATDAALKLEPGAAPPDNSITIPVLPAGGIVLVACSDANGFLGTLAGGSKDGIKITNLDGVDTLSYDIIVIGESA
jgi:hypothetical protein